MESWPVIGIVDEDYDTTEMPGFYNRFVGYQTHCGKIFDGYHSSRSGGKETVGKNTVKRKKLG